MSKYYLIAKDKNSDKFEIVKIRGNEIYSDKSDMLERCFNLENIDLFTSRFNSEESLINYLKSNGRINLDNCDIFIASRNGNNIKFLNCIYNFSNRVDLLRTIMIQSDQGRLNSNSKTSGSLLDDFINSIFKNKKYYDFVVYGFTDIYKKFVALEKPVVEVKALKDTASSKITYDDMLVEVMTYLGKFPRGMFIGDDLHFNERIFPGCDVSGLNKISVRLKRLVNAYTVNKYHLDRAYEYGGNTRELSIDAAADKKAILKLLESRSILEKFYNFCHLYDKIKDEYESKVKEGKVYGKRESN